MIDQVLAIAGASHAAFLAFGGALTGEQQAALTGKIFDNDGRPDPNPFISWSKTSEGQQAIREFADKFIKS